MVTKLIITDEPQGDDVKALLQDATVPEVSTIPVVDANKKSTKSVIASKGLTAAGASLLASEYRDDDQGVGNRMGDGSDRPVRDGSGTL